MVNKSKDSEHEKKHKKDTMTLLIYGVDELASALVMALLIIGFVIQPFIIPTGSMAETLRGAHFRMCCPQCGYHYDRDYQSSEYGLGNSNRIVKGTVTPPKSRCPSCGYLNNTIEQVAVDAGDKILALKSIYQFSEPKRWDVVVFRNPAQPQINYIKRLIGKPGEKVEIIDGDIYIDDMIARKPPKVQNELWMIIYDSDFIPVKPNERLFNGSSWKVPMVNYGDSSFEYKRNGGIYFTLDDTSGKTHRLIYDTNKGNDFRATYAYDPVEQYGLLPKCSDLKVQYEFQLNGDSSSTLVAAVLRKYQRQYKACIHGDGTMVIARVDDDGSEQILAAENVDAPAVNESIFFEFANLDHELIFKLGKNELRYDLGRAVDSAGLYRAEAEPEVEIIASGKLAVSHIKIHRDIHYITRGPQLLHAIAGSPMQLDDDEFFVLGDNSPASSDGRYWSQAGVGNNGKSYRAGVVPRDYLIGKALVVFWPSGFKPFEKFPVRVIPNLREVKLIYGGSGKSPDFPESD